MPYLLVKQKVKNFDNWYAVFKSEAKLQKEAGLHDLMLLHDIDDPNLIICLFKSDDILKAKSYINRDNLDMSDELSGIIGTQEVFFLNKL